MHASAANFSGDVESSAWGGEGWVVLVLLQRRQRRKVYLGANAVNEEDPERDRATQV